MPEIDIYEILYTQHNGLVQKCHSQSLLILIKEETNAIVKIITTTCKPQKETFHLVPFNHKNQVIFQSWILSRCQERFPPPQFFPVTKEYLQSAICIWVILIW